jgi:hypothetical protein
VPRGVGERVVHEEVCVGDHIVYSDWSDYTCEHSAYVVRAIHRDGTIACFTNNFRPNYFNDCNAVHLWLYHKLGKKPEVIKTGFAKFQERITA